MAKPIIDILVEASPSEHEIIKRLLVHYDYICMAQRENRIDFNRGYIAEGFTEKVFHIHLRENGDNNELYFRDNLNVHPEIAKIYAKSN